MPSELTKENDMGVSLPTREKNPSGLHQRYAVAKTDGNPIDPRAVYFVLRLDGFGDDESHIAASRVAALAYCDAIEKMGVDHLLKLAGELRQLVANLSE